jgi:hypothetical protein
MRKTAKNQQKRGNSIIPHYSRTAYYSGAQQRLVEIYYPPLKKSEFYIHFFLLKTQVHILQKSSLDRIKSRFLQQ